MSWRPRKPSAAPLAATLELVGGALTNNTQPEFLVEVPATSPWRQNEIIKWKVGGVLHGSSVVLTQGHIYAVLGMPKISALPDGANSITLTRTRAAFESTASNAVVVTIDTTAPTLSSPTGVATTSTKALVSVSTNEGNGTWYWVVTPTAMAAPTKAQIIAGNGGDGGPAVAAGSSPVTATGDQADDLATGLTGNTAYKVHSTQVDTATNQATVVTSSEFTTNAAFASTGWADTSTRQILTTNTNSYAFTSREYPAGVLVVGVASLVGGTTSNTVTSIDLGGTDIPIRIISRFGTGNTQVCALATVALAAPTTGVITVNLSGSMNNCALVWAGCTSADAVPTTAIAGAAADPSTATVVCPPIGKLFGIAVGNAVSAAYSWTNMTEVLDEAIESTNQLGTSYSTTPGSLSRSCDIGSGAPNTAYIGIGPD